MTITTRARRVVTAATATAAAAGLAIGISTLAQAAPSSHATSARIVPVCQPHFVVDWLDTNGRGAAGTIFFHLKFTNLSKNACRLQGFPFVFAVNLSGHQVGNRAIKNPVFPVKKVTIGKGKTIFALLGIVETGNFPASKCHPVTAAGLRVFAPTGINEQGRTIPFPFGACSTRGRHAPNFLTISPVKF